MAVVISEPYSVRPTNQLVCFQSHLSEATLRRLLASALAVALGASALLVGVATAAPPAAVPETPAAPAAPAVLPPLNAPVWMCKPGMPGNSCGQDAAGNPTDPAPTGRYADGHPTSLNATNVAANGSTSTEPLPVTSNPGVDCFYIYPTVDLLSNPLLEIGSNPPVRRDTETAVMLTQVGRFAGQCRIFAPIYRQATLLDYLLGQIIRPDFDTGFQDVTQAFDAYWNNDNIDPATGKRRGVVLIGHSQGAGMLTGIVQNRFDGKPAADQLVAAYLMGAEVTVPLGGTTGGENDPVSSFKHIPTCTRAPGAPVPTGCIVAYSANDVPPGATPGGFGTAPDPQHERVCVNPAALLAGSAPGAPTPIKTYLPTQQLLRGNVLLPNGGLTLLFLGHVPPTYPTGYAGYPGRVTGQCSTGTTADGARINWLQVDGLEEIKKPSAVGLGLHGVDLNVTNGDLAALIGAQSVAWNATH